MADDLKVVAELSLKDALTGPASKAVARVSADARKAAQEQAKSATSARTVADALAEVNKRGQEASRSVNGVAQALAHAAHTPFTTAAAQMRSLQQATGRTRREMTALLKVANRAGYVVGAGVRMAGNVATSTAAQVAGGIAAAGSAAHLVSMDSRYAALKANANMTKEEAAAFKSRVQGAAGATRVGVGNVMTLAEVMQDLIGDSKFYGNTLDLYSKAQRASGGNAADIGALAKVMHTMGITSREDTERGLSGAIAIGDKGSFTLRDFAQYGRSAAAAYSALGRGARVGSSRSTPPCSLPRTARAHRRRRARQWSPSFANWWQNRGKRIHCEKEASRFLTKMAIFAASLIFRRILPRPRAAALKSSRNLA